METQNSPASKNTSGILDSSSWEEISDILSSTKSNTSYKPSPAEPSLLLPNTFANVVRKRHIALEASLKSKKKHSSKDAKKLSNISTQVVAEVISVLKQLRAHYERLLSEPSRLWDSLAGFNPQNTIWVSPSAQPDFLSFIDILWARWGSSTYPREDVKNLLEWAMKPQIDEGLFHADIDSSASTYQTLEKAFQTFCFALEDMVNKHHDSKASD